MRKGKYKLESSKQGLKADKSPCDQRAVMFL